LAILIEGLNHLSKYNLIHRNLKPSSLYLRNYNLNNDKNDLSIQIGDFGVYTIMRDAKTKTRILPGK
jgi:serine/threonine kinase-like domain-containing protein STKLD1